MTFEASPFWQNAFLVGVLVAFGWCIWNGWRLGVVRALWSLLGMLAAGVAGTAVGLVLGAVAIKAVPMMGAMIGLAAGALVGLIVYFAAAFLGGLLFKRTAQQPTSILRFAYGMGGAAIGVFVGVSVLWSALLFVRGLGGFCEPTIGDKSGAYRLPFPEPMARALVKLKKSVEAGSTGKILNSIDVMPPEFYRLLDRFGQLAASPEAMRRFITYPGVADVLVDTHFLDLAQDSEVQEMVRSQNTSALLTSPKMMDAVKDPGLIAKLQKIDIEKALDYALNPPKPAATPAHKSQKP